MIKKVVMSLIFMSFLVSACGPGQLFGPTFPTFTPTPTNSATPTSTNTSTLTPTVTSTPTSTNTPTRTPTFTSTPTPLPTFTPTSPPGLGILTIEVVNTFTGLFQFNDIPDIDGYAAQKGITDEGFSSITLLGSPYLVKAELEIDLSKENSFLATGYWILFLEIASDGGKEAADWVHDNFSIAVQNGKVENTFGHATVILESNSSGSLFRLTVVPKESQ